jgi:hypothetical protein
MLPLFHNTKFRIARTTNMTPGKKQAVNQDTDPYHSGSPPEPMAYPLAIPRKRYRTIIPIRSIPLEAGDMNKCGKNDCCDCHVQNLNPITNHYA